MGPRSQSSGGAGARGPGYGDPAQRPVGLLTTRNSTALAVALYSDYLAAQQRMEEQAV